LKQYHEQNWIQAEAITSNQIPDWWTAYNKIKHDSSKFQQYATMGNAIRAIAASSILMYKVYGPGVTIGYINGIDMLPNGERLNYNLNLRKSQLFDSNDGRFLFII